MGLIFMVNDFDLSSSTDFNICLSCLIFDLSSSAALTPPTVSREQTTRLYCPQSQEHWRSFGSLINDRCDCESHDIVYLCIAERRDD